MQSDRHQGGRIALAMSPTHFERNIKSLDREVSSHHPQSASIDDRARALADIAAHGDEDNAECAAADLAREFPCDR
jgi:hypothetical protein